MIEINRNYNESNLETMAKMPDCFIDLIVTSPPYDNLRQYNGYSFDFETTAKELKRILKQGGIIVWVVADGTKNGTESGTSFKQALYFKEIGLNLHDTMIYRKENYTPLTHNRYEQEFEYMFVLCNGKPKTFNPIMIDCIHAGKVIKRSRSTYEKGISKRQASDEQPKPTGDKKQKGNVWSYKVGGGKTVNHVAQFPEQLANDHILSWSNEGDLVYDPFMGGGTTAKMAIINKRNWIGSEMSKEYCDIIEQRINPNGFEKTEVRGQKIFNYGLFSDNLD
jgi:site-specific DNA-methyltransferase (adenine-specific)